MIEDKNKIIKIINKLIQRHNQNRGQTILHDNCDSDKI